MPPFAHQQKRRVMHAAIVQRRRDAMIAPVNTHGARAEFARDMGGFLNGGPKLSPQHAIFQHPAERQVFPLRLKIERGALCAIAHFNPANGPRVIHHVRAYAHRIKQLPAARRNRRDPAIKFGGQRAAGINRINDDRAHAMQIKRNCRGLPNQPAA